LFVTQVSRAYFFTFKIWSPSLRVAGDVMGRGRGGGWKAGQK